MNNPVILYDLIIFLKSKNENILLILIISFGYTNFPEKRIVAEWEPSYGTMIRWPLVF